MSEVKKIKEVQQTEIPFDQMLDLAPTNMMLATSEGVLIYMNKRSQNTLKPLEQYLPDRVENLVGNSIDWFHKDPEHQKRLIANPNNLPHKAIIEVGPEKLDLLVSPVFNQDGSYMGPMVTWDVVTEKLKVEESMARAESMVERSPLNTMMCDPTGTILMLNEASRKTLKTLEAHLPIPVSKIQGEKIDIFHKDPEMQRKIIGDPSNLPHSAIIQVGPEKLQLSISGVMSPD